MTNLEYRQKLREANCVYFEKKWIKKTLGDKQNILLIIMIVNLILLIFV